MATVLIVFGLVVFAISCATSRARTNAEWSAWVRASCHRLDEMPVIARVYEDPEDRRIRNERERRVAELPYRHGPFDNWTRTFRRCGTTERAAATKTIECLPSREPAP